MLIHFSIVLLCLFCLQPTHMGKTQPAICLLPHSADGYDQPVKWRCAGQMPLWSYNSVINECVEFRYGGCGGNDNSFFIKEDCEEYCKL